MPLTQPAFDDRTLREPRSSLREWFLHLIRPAQQHRNRTRLDAKPCLRRGARFARRSEESTVIRLAAPSYGFWLVVFFVMMLMLLAYSYQPVRRFQSVPPPDFLYLSVPIVDRQQFAQEYWDCARRILPRYTYGVPLPASPPPDFHIPEEQLLPRAVADNIRLLYWKQLQKDWLNSSDWRTMYAISFNWILDLFDHK